MLRTMWGLVVCAVALPAFGAIGPPGTWPYPAMACRSAPDAKFGVGETFDPSMVGGFPALDAAITQALASPGPDGLATVYFKPGNYTLLLSQSNTWAVNARQKGVELCGDGGIASFTTPDGQGVGFAIDAIKSMRMVNMSFDGSWPRFPTAKDYIEIINSRIKNTNNECFTMGNGPGGHTDPTIPAHWLVYRSRLQDCGHHDGDGHAMYVSRRGCNGFMIESEADSRTELEAFRSLCRFNYWANNKLSNMGVVPMRGGQSGVVDIPSCGLTVLKRNKIVSQGDHAAVAIRARRSISGCDMPNQTEEGDTGKSGNISPFLVRSSTFWNDLRAGVIPLNSDDPVALLNNPKLFPVIFWDNEITSIDQGDEPKAEAITLYSTFMHDKDGNANEYLDPMHRLWTERAWALMVGQQPIGFKRTWEKTFNMPIGQNTTAAMRDYVQEVIFKTERIKSFELASPPGNWMPDTNNPKTICNYFYARTSWYDEPPPNIGFSSCANVPDLAALPTVPKQPAATVITLVE